MSDASLELLELALDLLTLGLLFIQLSLQLTGHLVVPVLGLLQVKADLMHVGKGVQILVLVHLLGIGFARTLAMACRGGLSVEGSWLH